MADDQQKPAADTVTPAVTVLPGTQNAQPTPAPATSSVAATDLDGLEMTTAKDGELPINQNNPTQSAAADLPATSPPVEPMADKPATPTLDQPLAVNEQPVFVTEKEVGSNPAPTTDVSEQIEVLAGEIQALEAKIDRLTGNASSGSQTTSVPVSMEKPASSALPPTANEPHPVEPTSLPKSTMGMAAISDEKAKTPVTDIYAKSAESGKQQDKKKDAEVKVDESDAVDEDRPSVLGTVGTILTVLGIIIFVVLLISPLFKEMIGATIWDMIRSIGWLTGLGTLGLGVLLSIFSPGKALMKVFAIILLILMTIIYLGINGFDYLFGPLQSTLSGLFSFYK